MKKLLSIIVAIGLMSANVMAESGKIAAASVSGTIVDTSGFGQCAAYIVPSPDSIVAGCKPGVVTFDCGAELTGSSRSTNVLKFDQALAANALGRAVRLTITDDKTIDGYCFVEQIRLRNIPAPAP